ncbi:MAG: ATP-dependent sacrificial sulfur transferase LarE [Candidatus Heimdallarchaeota archaeon]
MTVQHKKALSPSLKEKLLEFKEFFEGKSVVIAYSGGVDSSVLAELGYRYAKRMLTVTADSPTVLPGEVEEATLLAEKRKWNHRVIRINELEDPNFVANPIDRCYYCKHGLSEALKTVAEQFKADVIVEGTNFSEVRGHRPGLRALKEHSVNSPLLQGKLTKDDIRQLAHYFGLPNADKPSLACLSSRFPPGERITVKKLQRVGKAERYLMDTYGIRVVRVRDHDGLARVEVAAEEREKLLEGQILDDINQRFKEFGYRYAAIDCGGYRTGSLVQAILEESDL